jgi:pimeloyl-ACP methyl ester carboxylesterase
VDPKDEVQAAAAAFGDALAALVGTVGDMHAAVLRRVSASLPQVARPVADVQDAIVGLMYEAAAAANRGVPVAVASLLDALQIGPAAPTESALGRAIQSAVGGLWGDRIAEFHPAFAVRVTVREDGADVPAEPASVAAAFPGATARLVVLVHGLSETDETWQLGGRSGRTPYADRLRDAGFTPVHVRYNSGLAVIENAAALADLLDALIAAWPVEVDQVHLVGHSMGGLVAEVATRHADREALAWAGAVRTVVTLGSPHGGAPLAKSVHLVELLLERFAETAPLARILHTRSEGVHDLRVGVSVTPVDYVTYRRVAVTVTTDPRHPVGRVIGDGLVRTPSAHGVPGTADVVELGGRHHFQLLDDPEIDRLLPLWLGAEEA